MPQATVAMRAIALTRDNAGPNESLIEWVMIPESVAADLPSESSFMSLNEVRERVHRKPPIDHPDADIVPHVKMLARSWASTRPGLI